MDCFGPFLVKERRSEVKRWGLLFTCLYSRAVHVEILDDMSTDCFINALRAFVCLRGAVQTISCDQGTNFVGASNELRKEFNARNSNSVLGKYLGANQIVFNFNAPHASHAGGVWERQIRSIRGVLNALMNGKFKNRLSTSGLRVAFLEAMATVNSRPITGESLDDPEVPILTPNHLLTSKTTGTAPPPGRFDNTEIYSQKMWRRTQQFADEFWAAWKNKYLDVITKRQRWERPQPDLGKGDIVLVTEDNLPRNLWTYGIIDETITGSDGKVRKGRVRMANSAIDNQGKAISPASILERPIQKLILLQKGKSA